MHFNWKEGCLNWLGVYTYRGVFILMEMHFNCRGCFNCEKGFISNGGVHFKTRDVFQRVHWVLFKGCIVCFLKVNWVFFKGCNKNGSVCSDSFDFQPS